MKCRSLQRRLLAVERPDQLGADLQRHLADCDACRVLHRRLVELERDLPLLPVPASTRRTAFVAQFVQQTPVELAAAPLITLHRRTTPIKERGHRKLAFALALAASLAFLVLGLGLWRLHNTQPTRPDLVAGHQASYEIRLKMARDPGKRVEAVLSVADDVLADAHKVDAEQLAKLARFYRELVGEGLQAEVNGLPADGQRRAKLNDLADTVAECRERVLVAGGDENPDGREAAVDGNGRGGKQGESNGPRNPDRRSAI